MAFAHARITAPGCGHSAGLDLQLDFSKNGFEAMHRALLELPPEIRTADLRFRLNGLALEQLEGEARGFAQVLLQPDTSHAAASYRGVPIDVMD